MLPQSFPAAFLVQDSLEQRTRQLLHLVDQKSQHHQYSKHHRQVILAVSIVVLEMIALILQGIEGLILDFPACPSSAHDREDVQLGNGAVRDPTEVLGFVLSDFPILDLGYAPKKLDSVVL